MAYYSESYRQRVESYARDLVKTARTIANHEDISQEAAALAVLAAVLIEIDDSIDGLS